MQTSTILVTEFHAGTFLVAEPSSAPGRLPQYRRNEVTEISLASGGDEASRVAQSTTVPGTALPAARRHDCYAPGGRANVGSQLGP